MAQIDIATIRQRLEADRSRLEAEIYDHTQGDAVVYPMDPVSDSNGVASDQADDADAVENAERMNAITRNSQVLLSQVNAALTRIADGTYGTCTRCGLKINAARLTAMPEAAMCAACASWVEHKRRA